MIQFGAAAVTRHFKQRYSIISNDLLSFLYCMQRATSMNDGLPEFRQLTKNAGINAPPEYFAGLDETELEALGKSKLFFYTDYFPVGGRMYISEADALRFDFIRNNIEGRLKQGYLDENEYFYLVACAVRGFRPKAACGRVLLQVKGWIGLPRACSTTRCLGI